MRDLLAKLRGKIFSIRMKLLKKNISIEEGLRIYKKLQIKGAGRVIIGKNCTALGAIGNNNRYVTIFTHQPDASIIIGDNVTICATTFGSKFEICIGNDVLIEECSIVDTDFHSIDRGRGSPIHEEKKNCKVIIGNRVSIASGSIIQKGVSIGDDSIIGPGSIVASSVPEKKYVCGNPARIVKI